MNILKRVLPGMIFSALASCSPPANLIIAVSEQSHIVFHVRKRGFFVDKPFGWDDDELMVGQLTVWSEDMVFWQILEKPQPQEQCRESNNFPVRYGRAKCNFEIVVNAKPLRKNVTYSVSSSKFYDRANPGEFEKMSGTGGGIGKFRLSGGDNIRNLRPD